MRGCEGDAILGNEECRSNESLTRNNDRLLWCKEGGVFRYKERHYVLSNVCKIEFHDAHLESEWTPKAVRSSDRFNRKTCDDGSARLIMTNMELADGAGSGCVQFRLHRGSDRRYCFIRWRSAFFCNRIANVPHEIGQQNSPGLGLGVPRGFEEANIQRAVEPSLRDPRAKHLHRILISFRGRWNYECSHDLAVAPTGFLAVERSSSADRACGAGMGRLEREVM